MSEAPPASYKYNKIFDDLPTPVLMVRTPDGRDLAVNPLATYDHNPSIFLLHGSPGCRLGPLPRKFALHTLGVNVISYDRPGYGRSTRLEDRSVADAAQDVAAIADAFGLERFSVVGRSGGAAHALGCAALLGDRVISVAGLVGIAPPTPSFDRYDGMASNNAALYQQSSAELQSQYAAFAEAVAHNPSSFLDDFLLELMPDVDKRVIADAGIRALHLDAYHEALIPQQGIGWVDDTLAARSDWGFNLSDVHQPTLLWHGESDQFSPYANSLYMAEQIRAGGNQNVHTQVTPNAGHFGALSEAIPVLAWLREQHEA